MNKNYFFLKKLFDKNKVFFFSILAFLATINMSAQYSWVGSTNTDFLDATNWNTAPGFTSTATFTVGSGSPNNPILGSAGYPKTSSAPTAGALTINDPGNLTLSGSININSATYWMGTCTINGGTTNVRNSFYLGSSSTAGTVTPTVNVETGGALNAKTYLIISNKQPGILNVNGGIITTDSGGFITIGNYPQYSPCNGILNLNSGEVHARTNGLTIGTKGTINVYGGLMDIIAGNTSIGRDLNVYGGNVKLLAGTHTINSSGTNTSAIINISGGNLDIAGSLTIGAGTININSGLMNFSDVGTLTINGTSIINIDAGSIVLMGNQTTAISTYINNNVIKLSGQALINGKIISNTYNSVTNKTTIVAVSPPNTSWNGTTWANGTPDTSKEVIIDGTYSTTTNGAFTALKLTVNAGKSLTINTGTKVTVQNEVINNGTLVVENNANLIQVNNTTNTGAITVQRNSNALSRLDYSMWSSPVTGQNLVAFSPLTSQSPSRFYTYDATTNLYAAVASPTTTNFITGTGYLIRMPNTAVVAPATETFAGVFTGVPNNGNVSLTGLTSNAYYAVGNPYPSTLSAASFLSGNATAGTTLYLWRKTNGVANSGSSYATWTTLGGTAAGNVAPNDIAPNGTIQVGQGFIVNSGTATTLTFTNAMREAAPTSTQFLKIAKTDETSRIWLNLTGSGLFSQALIGYVDGATEGVDNGIDGKYINDSKVALTSNIDGEEYTIQGRPAFDASDVVPLTFKTDKAGEYKIAIDHTDGLFAKGQNVYLLDSVTGTETNLTKEAYTFTAESGATNSRFSLKYESTSKVSSAVFNENTVTVYKNNGTLYVDSATSAIVNIKVFNVQGRLIAELKGVNATTAAIKNLKANHQILLIQVTSEDKKVVNKKVVN